MRKEITIITTDNGWFITSLVDERNEDMNKRTRNFAVVSQGDPRSEMDKVCEEVRKYLVE